MYLIIKIEKTKKEIYINQLGTHILWVIILLYCIISIIYYI